MRTLFTLMLFVLTGCTPELLEEPEPPAAIDFEPFEGRRTCGNEGPCAEGTWCRWEKCVECRDRLDCPDDKPICVTGQCMTCSGDSECHHTYPTRPWCENGQCVTGVPYGTYEGER